MLLSFSYSALSGLIRPAAGRLLQTASQRKRGGPVQDGPDHLCRESYQVICAQ
ncbi:hypothetical protein CL3_20300 [butyrate-producing bacterium SM4/1]|nr:hypothetical protein CLOM621_08595 [Clostridium sp. M62/1]CBK78199.1 hypothetical protein CLS_28900 [[Clostridium] cf. saccharolyticum K10]CBL36404.1 hypothetical protein CL3_20300 [butyrate-producing bacterium SM4/1]